ncbi:MAG TPA: indole-3-glycerol phosphate synthase TrpC [Vicinamibacteria bacterium]|nr:indole-3-glycerol phosphate synthase TrpC [Vicinamibacteria bacterium]
MKTSGVLSRILTRTRERVAERRKERPLDKDALVAEAAVRRSFSAALSRPGKINVIAEFKRRSPSRGILREDLAPAQVAQAYEVGGAAALSVLTEEQFFGGSVDDLREARQATLLPTLRKDFVIDPYQVWESLLVGADAVLLIVAAVSDLALRHLAEAVRDARLEAVFEVHDADDLRRALRLEPRIVGVNNRDLRTLAVDIQTSLDLVEQIPEHVIAVAESGLKGPGEIRRLRDAGFDAFLVGEHLMLAPDPVVALERLLEASAVPRSATAPRGPGRVAVKVCGITSLDDARTAVEAGADAVGFVFWPKSPRAVDPDTARAIAAALPPFVLRVGVFVDETPERMRRIADEVGLDMVQLHGSEPPADVLRAPRRAVKAVRVGPGFRPEAALRYDGAAAGLLLDTRGEGDGPPGGTGRPFDWSQARPVRAGTSFLVLAGGLTPDNVGEAIAAVRPDAVDVSSGVESAPGRKDPAKVRAFVDAVRARR